MGTRFSVIRGRLGLGLVMGLILLAGLFPPTSPARAAELFFRVMAATYQGGQLTRAAAGTMAVSTAEGLFSQGVVSPGGRLEFTVPVDRTSRWVLSLPGFADRHFRAQWEEGFLLLFDEDNQDAGVPYFQGLDGSYALEYYWERVLLSNLAGELAPIMGRPSRDVRIRPEILLPQQSSCPGAETAKVASLSVSHDVAVAEGFAYLADGSAGLRIINIDDKFNPREVAVVPPLEGEELSQAFGVFVQEGLVFLADFGGGLRIIDARAKSEVRELGRVPTRDVSYNVYVQDETAYLADASGGGLRIIDVSDPTAPREVGRLPSAGDSRDVFVLGKTAYLADGPGGLRIVDVRDPSSPREVGVLPARDLTRGVNGVRVAGTTAYLTEGEGGLRIADVSDPARPRELGSLASGDISFGLFVQDQVVLLADNSAGLRIIDAGDPTAPVELGRIETQDRTRGVFYAGGYAYLADWEAGLRLVSVAGCALSLDPSLPPPGGAYGHFGGGGNIILLETLLAGPAALPSDLVFPLVMGLDPGPAPGLAPFRSGIPFFGLAWTAPSGAREEWLLPINNQGVLTNGAPWETSLQGLQTREGVVDLVYFHWLPPAPFLAGLSPGVHRLEYFFQDLDGNRSNPKHQLLMVD